MASRGILCEKVRFRLDRISMIPHNMAWNGIELMAGHGMEWHRPYPFRFKRENSLVRMPYAERTFWENPLNGSKDAI